MLLEIPNAIKPAARSYQHVRKILQRYRNRFPLRLNPLPYHLSDNPFFSPGSDRAVQEATYACATLPYQSIR